jgi:hypothetical protein
MCLHDHQAFILPVVAGQSNDIKYWMMMTILE